MYKIVGKTLDENVLAVLDSNDNTVEPFTKAEAQLLLQQGITMEGATINSLGDITLDPSVRIIGDSGNFEDDEEEYEEEIDEYSIEEEEEWEEEDIEEVFGEDDLEAKAEEIYNSLTDEDQILIAKYLQGIISDNEKQTLLSKITDEDIKLLDEVYDMTEGIEFEDEEDDWEEVEEEEHSELNQENAVTKLYRDILTPEQKKILQTYYLWYSRHIFETSEKAENGTSALNQSLKRQKKLASMAEKRKESEHWVYGGFVDFGEVVNERPDMQGVEDAERDKYQCDFGAGLGHGHNLRYMHIIWDADYGDLDTIFFGGAYVGMDFKYNSDFFEVTQSEHSIKTGVNCLADFFEVADKKGVVSELMAVQRSAIADLELLYKIYTEEDINSVKHSFDMLTQVVNASYNSLIKSLMLKKDNVDKNTFIPLKHYKAIVENDIIPPQSLVQTVRDILAGWYITSDSTVVKKIDYRVHSYPGYAFLDKYKGFHSQSTLKAILKSVNATNIDVDYICDLIKIPQKHYNYNEVVTMMRNTSSAKEILTGYLTYLLTQKVCGFYENNCVEVSKSKRDKTDIKYKFTSEGGTAKDVVSFYSEVNRRYEDIGDYNHDLTTLVKVCELLTLIHTLEEETDPETAKYRRVYETRFDEEKQDYYIKAKIATSKWDYTVRCSDSNSELAPVFSKYEDYITWLGRFVYREPIYPSSKRTLKTILDESGVIQRDNTAFDSELKEAARKTIILKKKEAEELAKKQEEERQRELEKAKIEEEKKKKQEEFDNRMQGYFGHLQEKGTGATTSDTDVLNFLENYDLTTVTDPNLQTNISIFNSWYTKKNTYPTPTRNMMFRIRQLYDALNPAQNQQTGVYTVNLADIQEAKDGVDWLIANPDKTDERTVSILKTIQQTGTISKRQSKYVVEAIRLKAEQEGSN